ncbi:protein XRI1 [Citrus sinensis]|uniref:protein XRI1 n=1 Tax=Citrus sinensis TaxID=2711 RepID=UPI000CED51A2|nr:protein XRI1 isoform X1 [Citrus x clementina]XP_024034497.1 protein XRI1 isoform X1 [Citrus x clementina]XP_024034498.1 protein XRI1 isoform X1 [Citrus x clementina]XP_024034499.1 protein XRI1 isoform X1 [Citrus x clementina]XP_052288353.1 protein XRI1 [Citrus sinensis]KAH9654909.1 protein XRI1 [Citrus sinensis]
MSGSQWNEVALNGEDLSYMLDDETTPVKACGDLAYHATHNGNMSKETKDCRETYSQIKRRRMLQFDTQVVDSSLCSDEMPSPFLKSNERGESVEEVLPEASQWTTEFSAGVSASSCDGTDQSLEGWISECLNDPEMNFSTDELLRDFSGASDIQIDISEFSNSPPAYDANILQQHCTKTPHNVVFRGRKSLIRTPTKLASSVAYPFAFIKPCGVHGDITLKDINQRIHSPASTLRQNTEDPSAYPKSAFSGKPVVGKTKIRTEGGKGSITIMRTKG